MISLFHGENIVESRKAFMTAKQTASAPCSFEGSEIMISDLIQASSGNNLFGNNQQIFIEELLSKKKLSNDTKQIIDILLQYAPSTDMFLWESQKLTPAQLRTFTHADIHKFDLPYSVFKFLDSLSPGHCVASIGLFHSVLLSQEVESIFYMIVRHFRILLALSEPSPEEMIDEIKRLTSWQRNKLYKQTGKFTKASLLHSYKHLFAIESHMKTGKLAMPIDHAIDFFLMTL